MYTCAGLRTLIVFARLTMLSLYAIENVLFPNLIEHRLENYISYFCILLYAICSVIMYWFNRLYVLIYVILVVSIIVFMFTLLLLHYVIKLARVIQETEFTTSRTSRNSLIMVSTRSSSVSLEPNTIVTRCPQQEEVVPPKSLSQKMKKLMRFGTMFICLTLSMNALYVFYGLSVTLNQHDVAFVDTTSGKSTNDNNFSLIVDTLLLVGNTFISQMFWIPKCANVRNSVSLL